MGHRSKEYIPTAIATYVNTNGPVSTFHQRDTLWAMATDRSAPPTHQTIKVISETWGVGSALMGMIKPHDRIPCASA